MEVLLPGHGGDGRATAILERCHGGHGGHGGTAATLLRTGPTSGGTSEVWNMLSVRRATAKVRGSDSFRRCYGDQ